MSRISYHHLIFVFCAVILLIKIDNVQSGWAFTGTIHTALYLNELVIDKDVKIEPDVPFTISFETRIVNFKWYDSWDERDNDIIKFRAILSDVDIGAGHTNTLGTHEVVPDIIESLSQGLEEAGSIAISGTITDTLSAANCEHAAYICITYTNADDYPLYIYDWYVTDNVLCRSILDQTRCSGPNCLSSHAGEYFEDRFLCIAYANDQSAGDEAARSACRRDLGVQDAEVVEVVSEEMKQFLISRVIPETGEDSWIGFIESEFEQGTGNWLSGTEVTWTDWWGGRDNILQHQCVAIQNDGDHDYQWEDRSCTVIGPVPLCQFAHKCSTNPCHDRGRCVPNGKDDYTCECIPGYEGPDCRLNIDDCKDSVCFEHGTCIDGINTFTCYCLNGYTGILCDDKIDKCEPNPCANGGNCTYLDNGARYKCICPAGYTDPQCYTDVRECVGRTCNNHGVCVDGIDSWHCVCFGDWTGDECDTMLNHARNTLRLKGTVNRLWNELFSSPGSAEYAAFTSQVTQNLLMKTNLRGVLGRIEHSISLNAEANLRQVRELPRQNSVIQTGTKTGFILDIKTYHLLEVDDVIEALNVIGKSVDSEINKSGRTALDIIQLTIDMYTEDRADFTNQDINDMCAIATNLEYCKEDSTCFSEDGMASCRCRAGWTGQRCDRPKQDEPTRARFIIYVTSGVEVLLFLTVCFLLAYSFSNPLPPVRPPYSHNHSFDAPVIYKRPDSVYF